MSIRKTMILSAFLTLGVAGVVSATVGVPFKGDFAPTSPATKSGTHELRLTIDPTRCDRIELEISTFGRLVYTGDRTISLDARGEESVETVLTVTVEPNDTSYIQVDIRGCEFRNKAILYFVSTDDTLKYWKGIPNSYPERPQGRFRVRAWDQPTELQLDSNLYEYLLDLRKRMKRDFVKSLPFDLIPTGQKNFFKVWTTRERFRELMMEGVEGFMVEGQLDDSLLTPAERIQPDSSKSETKEQGVLGSPPGSRTNGDFSVVGIDGLAGGKLQANQPITYYIHIDN